jgi:hypothetical protein
MGYPSEQLMLPPTNMAEQPAVKDDTSTDDYTITTRAKALETVCEMMKILALLATVIFCVLPPLA